MIISPILNNSTLIKIIAHNLKHVEYFKLYLIKLTFFKMNVLETEHRLERWNKEYQDYISYRIERLKGLKKTNEFLMACNDPDLVVNIEVNNKILSDKIKGLLIERLEKIEGYTIKKSSDKVTHTKTDKKTQKCDISAVVFRRDSKEEVFRAAFSSSEKMK